MGIKQQDKKQESAFKDFMKDYKRDLQRFYDYDGIPFNLFTTFIGAAGGAMLGLMGGLASVGVVNSVDEDVSLQYGVQHDYGYEAISFDYEKFLLVHDDGQYRLYEGHHDHFDMELSHGDALAEIAGIVAQFDRAIAAYESGRVAGVDFPEINTVIDMTEAFNVSEEFVTREYDEMRILQPEAGQSYLQQLQQMRDRWQEAREQIHAGHYGIDTDALAYRLSNNDIDGLLGSAALFTAIGGLAIGGAGPAAYVANATRRRRKKNAAKPLPY
jgi:transcriptional regulator with XRE-family HTH domain